MTSPTDKRFGFIGIIIEKRESSSAEIQNILSDFGSIILGRMGLPHLDNDQISVITLIVNASTDKIGALTGKLGKINGISVKSGLHKK